MQTVARPAIGEVIKIAPANPTPPWRRNQILTLKKSGIMKAMSGTTAMSTNGLGGLTSTPGKLITAVPMHFNVNIRRSTRLAMMRRRSTSMLINCVGRRGSWTPPWRLSRLHHHRDPLHRWPSLATSWTSPSWRTTPTAMSRTSWGRAKHHHLPAVLGQQLWLQRNDNLDLTRPMMKLLQDKSEKPDVDKMRVRQSYTLRKVDLDLSDDELLPDIDIVRAACSLARRKPTVEAGRCYLTIHTACENTVRGSIYMDFLATKLKEQNFMALQQPEREQYCFGPGKPQIVGAHWDWRGSDHHQNFPSSERTNWLVDKDPTAFLFWLGKTGCWWWRPWLTSARTWFVRPCLASTCQSRWMCLGISLPSTSTRRMVGPLDWRPAWIFTQERCLLLAVTDLVKMVTNQTPSEPRKRSARVQLRVHQHPRHTSSPTSSMSPI